MFYVTQISRYHISLPYFLLLFYVTIAKPKWTWKIIFRACVIVYSYDRLATALYIFLFFSRLYLIDRLVLGKLHIIRLSLPAPLFDLNVLKDEVLRSSGDLRVRDTRQENLSEQGSDLVICIVS